MLEFCTSGSVGGLGGQPPRPTRPKSPTSRTTEATTAAKTEPDPPPAVTGILPANGGAAQPPTTTTASPVAPATAQRDSTQPPTTHSANVPSIEGVRGLEGHAAFVLRVAFSPDSKWLASASPDSTVRLWNVTGDATDTHIVLGTGLSQPMKQFICVAFSNNGRFLAPGDVDGRIFLWDSSKTPPQFLRILKKHNDNVVAIAFSPDSKSLATSDLDNGLIFFWDLTDPAIPLKTSINTGVIGVWALAYSPDGRLLFENINHDPQPRGKTRMKTDLRPQIWAWDVTQRPYVKASSIREIRDASWTMACSPDGSHIAYGDGDVVRVIDLKTGKQVTTLRSTRPLSDLSPTPLTASMYCRVPTTRPPGSGKPRPANRSLSTMTQRLASYL
jgi:WD40 repeat protein